MQSCCSADGGELLFICIITFEVKAVLNELFLSANVDVSSLIALCLLLLLLKVSVLGTKVGHSSPILLLLARSSLTLFIDDAWISNASVCPCDALVLSLFV